MKHTDNLPLVLEQLLKAHLETIGREVSQFIEDNPDLFEYADSTDPNIISHDIHETIRNCPYLAVAPDPRSNHLVQHVDQTYCSPANYLELHENDYYELKKFLEGLDIETRIMTCSGLTARVSIQGRNLLRESLSFMRLQQQQEVFDRARHMKNEGRWTL